MRPGWDFGSHHFAQAVVTKARAIEFVISISICHRPWPCSRGRIWNVTVPRTFSLPGSPPQLVSAGQVHPTAECSGLVFGRREVLSGADNTARQRTRETQVRRAWWREGALGQAPLPHAASPAERRLASGLVSHQHSTVLRLMLGPRKQPVFLG